MAGALVLAVAGLEVTAVVRGEQHDRVVEQVEADERIHQPAEGLVETPDHAVVAGEVLRAAALQGDEVRRDPVPRVHPSPVGGG